MPTDKYKISVIIPTYNRSKNLEYTIKSLLKQTLSGADFEIVVADDGSSDDTFEMLRQFNDVVNLRYVYQEDNGYRPASARNLGIKVATGTFCLFIDSGIIVKSDCLEAHLEAHRRQADEVAVIGYTYGYTQHGETEEELIGLVDPYDADGSMDRLVKRGRFLDIRERIYRKYGDDLSGLLATWSLFWGGHLSVKRSTLMEVGLFDEGYDGNWGCEDNDLGYRLLLAGRDLHFCREAAVLHLPHGTDLDLKRQEGYANCKYFHNKYHTAETQLFFDYYLQEITGHEVLDFHELILESEKLFERTGKVA